MTTSQAATNVAVPATTGIAPAAARAQPAPVTDEEVAPILRRWAEVIRDYRATEARKAPRSSALGSNAVSNSDGRGPLGRATEADVFVYELVGLTLTTALGFIPAVGPIISAIFSVIWGIFTPSVTKPDPLVVHHDKLVALIRHEINLNNVQQQLDQGRAYLVGIQHQGDEFRRAYDTWKALPGDPGRRSVLQAEFISLKNALIRITPYYWESPGLPLLQLGCTTTSLFIPLLRDAIREGTTWGFDAANVNNFQQTLTTHINYIAARCLQTELSGDRTFAAAGDFIYMDPSVPFLGPQQRRINFLRDVNDTRGTLPADRIYVVAGPAIGNSLIQGVERNPPRLYSGISSRGAIAFSRLPGTVRGTLRFDRAMTFEVRWARQALLGATLNGVRFYPSWDEAQGYLFTTPVTVSTVNNAITFEVAHPGGHYYLPPMFGDIIFTPRN
ncbi:hypothetical protein DXG03_005735 [Asterophora parasitica]|uniref:Pesticidal crystal protein domain-containing protein n=1 Tax=Asterophora parasitica TaxID=117018 RepID=A0A9P7GEM3_9AGAR|nr:hypothetical protein DXG03_005735 [Asterophora parasitica]